MKKIILLVIAIVMLVTILPTITTATANVEIKNLDKAIVLKNLGLMQAATIKDLNLDQAVTRAQVAVMLVRLLGKEEYVRKNKFKHPFKDVPGWADSYVGYLYQNKLTGGISATKYGSNDLVTAEQYITFVLRALGYSDTKGDFKLATSLDFAWDIGVIDNAALKSLKTKSFLRDDMALISYDALSSILKGSTTRLINKLINENAIKKEVAEANNINVTNNIYEIKNYGTINNIKPFTDIKVDVDPLYGSTYKHSGKAIRLKIDSSKLPTEAANYAKVGRIDMYGDINVSKINESLDNLKKFNRIFSNNNFQYDSEGYLELGAGSESYMLLVLYDSNNNPLAYTVIHFLGFNNDDDEYHDITYRLKKINLGDSEDIKFFDGISIYGWNSVNVKVDKSLIPEYTRNSFKMNLMFYTYNGDSEEKEILSDRSKIISMVSHRLVPYGDGIYAGETYSIGNARLLAIVLSDSNNKIFGYCILKY